MLKDEIGFALAREEEMSRLQQMRDAKLLPTRVTHNDTKLSNILLDADTRKALENKAFAEGKTLAEFLSEAVGKLAES